MEHNSQLMKGNNSSQEISHLVKKTFDVEILKCSQSSEDVSNSKWLM